MKHQYIIAASTLVAMATFSTIYFGSLKSSVPQEVRTLYQNWKAKHRLSFNLEEDASRLRIFYNNFKFVQKHNANLNNTYTVGLNKFAALSLEEFLHLYTGVNAPKTSKKNIAPELLSVKDLPESVNWTDAGYVTPIKDQGKCGSCWAFSAIGALEATWKNYTKKLVSLSEQQLVDCSTKQGNRGCSGGWMDWAFDYVQDNAIETTESYPYTGNDGFCNDDWSLGVFRIDGYKYVKHNDSQQLMAAVAQIPTSASVAVGTGFQLYTGGIITQDACVDMVNHGILVAGYGHDNKLNEDYWLIKNSWGADWGEAGYIRLKKTLDVGLGTCLICTQPVWPFKK
jgi:C1A family cysteine protease